MIEILGAVTILSFALLLIATMIVQNKRAIDLNTRKEEAIAVRDDVKEWMQYQSQIVNLTGLNRWVYTPPHYLEYFGGEENSERVFRRSYFILDNSGIQSDNTTSLQGKHEEIRVGAWDEEDYIPRVIYDPSEGHFLPATLAEDERNKFFIGQYVGRDGQPQDYLVAVRVDPRTNHPEPTVPGTEELFSNQTGRDSRTGSDEQTESSHFSATRQIEPRKDGILLTIQIYDKNSGQFLTETYLNWVAES